MDFIAEPISLKNTDRIFFPIVELSIFPFIAELIKSFASMSKFSSLYLLASSIKSDIPHRFGLTLYYCWCLNLLVFVGSLNFLSVLSLLSILGFLNIHGLLSKIFLPLSTYSIEETAIYEARYCNNYSANYELVN